MSKIIAATGATITPDMLMKDKMFDIREYGACADGSATPMANTKAINSAIEAAANAGGGTVLIPRGEFKTYTIRLQSHVNLYLSEGSVLRAARTDITGSYEKQIGEGGKYDEPEVNLYAGLQDHGHTYFANSLLYGADLEQIMIYGSGRIDGSCYNEESGYRQYVLMGGDPLEPETRNVRGHNGEWFGNKAIALVRCRDIVMKDFSLVIGGHFAVIAEGVVNMLIDHVLIDTTRDALDIDCCQDVTVRDTVLNSLTDDALVLKASYGAGLYMPTKNVLIEDCTVSGYDAGSVYAGKYTKDKLVATDRCGPTGRVKLGTESTCGYDQVTVRRVRFDRSRGFALEAVDGSDLSNVIFTDCTMDNVSSSPIFIRIGDRGRFPVTGMQSSEEIIAKEPNVRLDNKNWVLPDTADYQKYPAKRYLPSYKKDRKVTVDGCSYFQVVDETAPARLNAGNVEERDGIYYGKQYTKEQGYQTDWSAPLTKKEALLRGNAAGCERPARVYNIEISNVTITNADPRYPILLMGLTDSRIENVVLRNIKAEFRGGMTMEHAVEQRQLNTNWEFAQYETAPSVQTLPWLVNPFFLKEEGLLPRVDWDRETKNWKEDPYNVPELPAVYPEPSNWGILPAYGLYARHVDGLVVDGLTLEVKTEDERHAIVFDDAANVTLNDITADIAEGQSRVALVTNSYKRHTHEEYLPDVPYFETTVSNVSIPPALDVKLVTVDAPAPGTPRDSQYGDPTLPVPEYGYSYAVATDAYPLPKTVYRPFFSMEAVYEGTVGTALTVPVILRNPAAETSSRQTDGFIYNEAVGVRDYVVMGKKEDLSVSVSGLPDGAVFDRENMKLLWTPGSDQTGKWTVELTADDGVIPERFTFVWEIK